MGLLAELRAARCSVSVITTYSVDFHFYEAVVLRRLNAAGCEHHVLLVDAVRCGEALADPDRRPRLAGVSYTLLPISFAGAFHPKLILLAGKKSSRLFLGSHNLTVAGFGGNAEITNAVGGQAAGERGVIVEALNAVRAWASNVGASPNDVFDVAQSLIGATSERARAGVSLLYSGVGRPPLWEQLRPLLPDRPRRVTIVGPFFDEGMQFIRRAMSDLHEPEFVVAVDPSYSDLRSHEARKTGARFVDARACLARLGFADSSSLHAKMILVDGDEHTVLVAGSANPSNAAWLRENANAEAALVRADPPDEDLMRLALRELADAPEITTAQWAEVDARRRDDGADEPSNDPVPRAVTAVEDHGQITVHGIDGRPPRVRLLFRDGHAREAAAQTVGQGTLVVADEGHDLSTCNLVEVLGERPALAIVNHVSLLSPRGGGVSAGGALTAALGAVTDDASRIEEVLKIVERAIDEADDPVASAHTGGATHPDTTSTDDGLGSRSMSLEEARRRHGRGKRLATGDVGVVIDLLIRRIAEGLPSTGGVAPPREVEEGELDPIEEAARTAGVPVDPGGLVNACHRKIRRLLRRMVDRLDHVMDAKAGAARAAVQLAAVLGVLRWLRRIERQLAWLPQDASLIPTDARDNLFRWAAMYLGVSKPSLGDRVGLETGDRSEELVLATGLVAWLGREAAIEVRACRSHPDEEELTELPWAGLLLMLLRLVVFDEQAKAEFAAAVAEGRGRDREGREAWASEHLRMAEIAALAEACPGDAPIAQRRVQRGDLVTVDMPNGIVGLGFVVGLDDTKVRLLDAQREDGRAVLKRFVKPVDIGARPPEW